MSSSLPLVVDESLLKCPLCCRSADDPRLLPCLHIFCRSCLINYIDKYNANLPEVEYNSEEQTEIMGRPPLKPSNTASKSSLLLFASHQKKFGSLSRQSSTGCALPPPPTVPPPLPPATMSMKTQSFGLDEDYEDGDGYEVPNDHQFTDRDTYEDVEQDSEGCMYVNSQPSCDSRKIERGNIGYVTMGHNRAAAKPPQQQNLRRRCRSAPRTRPTTVTASGLTAATSSPSCRRSPSPIIRGQHAQRQVLEKSFSVNDDGLYENSEDDVDDVIPENRKSRIIPGAREVRRWKVAGESAGVPRMKRRIRRDSAVVSSPGPSDRTPLSNAVRPTTDEKRRELTKTPTGSSNASPNHRRPEISSFDYIYGDRQRPPADNSLLVKPEALLKADTLDRHIPVYEVFKSAKLSGKKSLDTSLTGSVLQNVFGSSTTDGYVELEQRRTQTADGLYGIEHTFANPSNSEQVDHQMLKSDIMEFTCPVCDEHVPVSMISNEEPDIETCESVVRPYGVSVPFVSAMTELVRLQTVDWRCCGGCNGGSAVSRCLQCRRDLCSTCCESHSRLEQSQHLVVDLQDVQSGRHQRELIQTGLPMTPCLTHPSRTSVGYCTGCDATVCDQCRSSGLIDGGTRRHKDTEHNVIEMKSPELEEAATRERDMITTTVMRDVERRLIQLNTDADRIASYQRDIETERDKALQIAAQKKERLLSAVEKCYGELVQSIEEEYSFERDNVRALTAASDKNSARVEHALRFARHLFELGRPADVTSLAAVVRSGLRSASMVPEVTIDARLTVQFLSSDDVKMDRIRRLFGPLAIDRIPSAVVEPKEELSGSVMSETGIGTGSIDLRKRRKSSTSDVEATHRVRRKPSVREPVMVTSFSAKTALDEKGCKPTGVAFVDDPDVVGQCLIIIVDDINKKLKVFDATNGQLHLEIKPEGRHRLVDPWDVAVLRRLPVNINRWVSASDLSARPEVLGEPRFVVSDRGARDVKIFTESGEFVTSFGRHLSSPWGVATSAITRQVLVTDAVHKTVFVHDATGNLLFCVQSKVGPVFQLQCPEYVAVSPVNGDIIVTDFERHTVVFFDKYGRFLTQYNGDNEETTGSQQATDVSTNAQRRLKVPCGVAISCAEDGGRVYVADYNNRRIVRLSRNGRYDACFAASNSIALVSPQAIDFTSDGRLVVADRTNLKIFDVGVRSRAKSFRVDGSSFSVQQDLIKARDEVVLKSDEVVLDTTKTATPIKPRPIGPKPIIAPRPKPPPIGSVETVPTVETSDSRHTGKHLLTTISSAATEAAPTSRRRSSLPYVLQGSSANLKIPKNDSNENATMVTRSYLETEVW